MLSRPITRILIDKDSGHAPGYASSVAYSFAQKAQDENETGLASSQPTGPYAGSGNVKVGAEGRGVHRQFDLRMPHLPIPPNTTVESSVVLEGGNFPWLKTGSETVYINTQKCGRKGDWTVCGAVITDGLKDVLVGD